MDRRSTLSMWGTQGRWKGRERLARGCAGRPSAWRFISALGCPMPASGNLDCLSGDPATFFRPEIKTKFLDYFIRCPGLRTELFFYKLPPRHPSASRIISREKTEVMGFPALGSLGPGGGGLRGTGGHTPSPTCPLPSSSTLFPPGHLFRHLPGQGAQL